MLVKAFFKEINQGWHLLGRFVCQRHFAKPHTSLVDSISKTTTCPSYLACSIILFAIFRLRSDRILVVPLWSSYPLYSALDWNKFPQQLKKLNLYSKFDFTTISMIPFSSNHNERMWDILTSWMQASVDVAVDYGEAAWVTESIKKFYTPTYDNVEHVSIPCSVDIPFRAANSLLDSSFHGWVLALPKENYTCY